MSVSYEPTWADVLEECAAEPATARRLIGHLRACEISALAFCRLLERWARGDAQPPTPGERRSALRRAAERVETALTGLEEPLKRYLLELEADVLEGRSWYGGPSSAELLDDDVTEIKLLQEHVHDALGGIVYDRTRRRPMILPVLVEV